MAGRRPKHKRTPLARCIWQDKYGISIIIRGQEKGNRFPLGTPLEQLLKERDRIRESADARPSRRHTLRADCADHLKTIPEGRAREEQRAICDHWCRVFGDRASASLEPKEIRAQLAAWTKLGPQAPEDPRPPKPFTRKHLNNMIHVLRAVYKTNYGTELNPAAEVPVYTVKYTDARAIPDALVDTIIDGMSDTRWPAVDGKKPPPPNLAKLRFRVMRETGFNQAMVKRVQRHHLNFTAKTVYTEVRRKGRGVEGATIDLTDAAVKAWRALQRAGGLGAFNTRSLAYCWRRAVERAQRQWIADEANKKHPRPWPLPEDVRAYDLRHTFGSAAIIASNGDLEAVANLMRQANLNTTRRYLQAVSQARGRAAVKALNKGGRLA